MQQINLLDKYPVLTMTLAKSDSKFDNVDAIMAHLKTKIDEHKIATFISEFDNFAHTKSIGGKIDEDVLGAKNIMFCFGKAIPEKTILAVRPRSIGVVEDNESFTISYLQAPNEEMGKVIETWIKEMQK